MEELKKRPDQLIVAVPSKGRPKEHTINFLKSKNYNLPSNIGRLLQTHFVDNPNYKVAFFHAKDIPFVVEQNMVDIGFTGLDLLHETRTRVRPVIKLNLGKVKMAIAVRSASHYFHPFHLMNKVIATTFPSIASEYFCQLKIPVTIHPISGASEGMPYLPNVDAVMDVVETGASIKENNLRIIADDVFDSELVCIVNRPEFSSNHKLVHHFLRRLYQ